MTIFAYAKWLVNSSALTNILHRYLIRFLTRFLPSDNESKMFTKITLTKDRKVSNRDFSTLIVSDALSKIS